MTDRNGAEDIGAEDTGAEDTGAEAVSAADASAAAAAAGSAAAALEPVTESVVETAADAVLPGTADAEGWRRLHPLSPLLRGGLVLLVIAGIIVANFRDRFVEVLFVSGILRDNDRVDVDMSGEGDVVDLVEYLVEEGLVLVALGIAAAAILLIVFFSWIAWRFSTYRITAEAVEARRGVLFRNHRRAPLERIQSVNLQRSLLARALGLTKIEVLTAGQGGKVELAFLGHRDAKLVREQIIRRAAAKRGEPEIAAPAAVDFAGRAYAEASGKLAERAQDFADIDIDPEAAATQALVRVPVGRLAGSIALSWESVITVLILIGIVVGGAVLEPALILGVIPMLIVMASITFSQFNKGFNFSLSRGRDSVRTGSGLTSTTTESIPFGRIHAVEARQPLLWRPLGWWKVRITTAGHSVAQGGQNSTQNVVLPVGVESDVLRVFETLLPGLGDDEHEIAGLRDGLSGAASGYLGAGPRAGWVLWWGRRRAGVDIADAETQNATLRVRRGALTRSLSIMPIVRAQSVQLRRPLAHRFLGLASLQAHTVLGPVRMEMRGIELGAAQRLFDELVSVVLRVQGADARGIGDLSAEDRSTEEQGLGEQSRETEATEPPSADPPTVEPGAAQSSTGESPA
ncbi:PH domain-containing protein [Leucobacter celer]|uniref:PH domain-containing protein n=1 Tax=Leucobacter celer TaxID=668625 RepID=UPI0006A78740|nr:PH domain-containing protein [Leucobacter celer]